MKVSLHQLHLRPVVSLPGPGHLDAPASPAEVALDLLYGLVPGLGDEHRREDPAQGADAPVQPECAGLAQWRLHQVNIGLGHEEAGDKTKADNEWVGHSPNL